MLDGKEWEWVVQPTCIGFGTEEISSMGLKPYRRLWRGVYRIVAMRRYPIFEMLVYVVPYYYILCLARGNSLHQAQEKQRDRPAGIVVDHDFEY